MEKDKIDVNSLPMLAAQYCEWEAKGTFEFNFYIDFTDLSQWDIEWDKDRKWLTLYPPDLGANTPAELEPLVYSCKVDSITIDEDDTKKALENRILNLKIELAEDQKRLMYVEAKDAIAKHFLEMLLFIPDLKYIDPPGINVVFPHEK